MPPTEWPTFAFEDRGIIYDDPDLLHDDYNKLVDYMTVSGETAVPLWVFRSLCESYARLMQRVSKGSDVEYLSAQNADFKERRADKILKIEENELTTHGAMAISGSKETVCQDSAMQEHSDPGTGSSHIKTHNLNPKHPSTEMIDVYEVLMSNISTTSMDLSNVPAMLQVAEELINSNKLAQSSSQASDHILYLRWKKKRKLGGGTASVCIGFTTLELASRAVMDGIRWAEKSHPCVPFATGYKQKYCTNCLEYGHVHRQCERSQRCSKCGLEHLKKDCQSSGKKCPTCGGAHFPGSPKCPRSVIEIRKAGLWPLRTRVVNTLIVLGNLETCELHGRTTSQSQAQSDIQQHPDVRSSSTVFSEGTENLPNPLDPEEVIEHLDRIRALVIAGGPTPTISETSARNKRKALAPVHHVSANSLRETPKRLKREGDKIKQEEEEAALALYERAYI